MRCKPFQTIASVLLLLTMLMPGSETLASTPEPEAAWQPVACPFTLPEPEREGTSYECGVVRVPIDHADPNGATIDLMFARLFATGSEVEPDPILWLEGGPGASALAVAETNRLITSGVRSRRDVILFDQRGAGFSGYLECGSYQSAATGAAAITGTPFPEPPANDASIAAVYDYAAQTAALGFDACRAGYAEDGIDLAHFSTEAIALDSVLILDALGYEQATLWGTSYGGRVATAIMRSAPERVRAAVLDSPLPLGIRRLETFASLETEPASNLFAWCAADSTCASAYPDLEARTLTLIDTLNAAPLPLDPEQAAQAGLPDGFTGAGLIRLLTAVLPGNPDIAGALPRAIADLERSDPAVALAILSGEFGAAVDRPIPPTLTETSFDSLRDPRDARLALSLAMRTAVLCNDESDVSLAAIATEEGRPPASPLRGVVPLRSAVTLYAQCRALNAGSLPLDLSQPTAPIPVLVLAGQFDGTTAPSWAEEAAQTLPSAQYVLVPGSGHATARWSECARDVIAGFIGDPSATIAISCLENDMPQLVLPDDPVSTG